LGDHPELGRDHVEPLGSLLANPMHRRMAAGTIGVFRLDRHIEVRQMTRQRAAIGAPLLCPRLCGRWKQKIFLRAQQPSDRPGSDKTETMAKAAAD
jgi:hypothetical protein